MIKKLFLVLTVCFFITSFMNTSVFAYDEKIGQVLTDNLNVRSSYEVDSEGISTLMKGDLVQVVDEYEGWYNIKREDVSGWVNSWFIYVEDEPVITGQINGENVNMRISSDLSSQVIGTLNDGSYINIYGRDNNWYFISKDFLVGWVYGDYITQHLEPIGSGVVLGDNVNIRLNPDLTSKVIGSADKGKHYSVYGNYDKWIKIKTEEGEYGWIYGDLINIRYSESSSRGGLSVLNAVEPPKQDSIKIIQQKLVDNSKSVLGVKYVWGGESPKGFDCSGFVKYVFSKIGVKLPHRADLQARKGSNIEFKDLKPGDAVFFDTNGGSNYINHTGIYIGNGQFIHASSSSSNGRCVVVSDLSGFYLKSYMGARRYLDY